MLTIVLKVGFALLSIFSIIGSTGIFSPAVALAILLMCMSGVVANFGHVKFAILNLALTSIALAVSPATDVLRMESPLAAILWMVPIIIGFGGVMLAVHRMQKSQKLNTDSNHADFKNS